MAIECTRGGFLAHRRDGNPGAQGASSNAETAFSVDQGPRGPGVWGPSRVALDVRRCASAAGIGQDVAVGSLRYTDGAECEAKHTSAHWALLQDLSEHIHAERGRILLPCT
eukprot:TRINITY_DN745_c0_g1_i4.p4 TRINITY_DN745_c0_g1~~TRINITY_DN745_c0_g1_i4.p4  ORF type:complete len:111 (-),score=13.84 TRINITY_DN745_c0_g1_i4:60-392(-)